jgi:hypothetical protein
VFHSEMPGNQLKSSHSPAHCSRWSITWWFHPSSPAARFSS